ncbi:MAG: molybdenum cofactor guanylyltransferase [Pyrinomonadaceae bacterium]|nr:molybdenum cofactor guanylyltransferase [Pyrinomonadaceae bacterium]
MNSIAGFILAGGQSRRMGTDKWKLVLDGRSFVERVANEMAGVASPVTVVGNIAGNALVHPADATQTSLTTVPDVYPGWGALGGVHAALANCQAEWALVVACDFPFVTRELFLRLASLRPNFEAVAPVQRDQIPQPLCALYRVEPCRDRAEQMIKSGERKPVALLQSVHTRWVSFSEIEDLADAARFFDNINTPQDYDRISRKGG